MEQILVTGGRGGLGKAIAESFLAAGDEVLAPGRDELDVTDRQSVDNYFVRRATPDLLIANAGIAEDALLARCSEDSWDRQMDVSLNGSYRCCHAVAKGMVRRSRGHIVLISSQSALHPPIGQAGYATAKAGLIGLGMSLARELGPANIRVNIVLPGFLETRMTDTLSEERKSRIRADHALGRFNQTSSVADFILHLHRHLLHTSGQVFRLDSRIG